MVGPSDIRDYRLAADMREDFKVQGKPTSNDLSFGLKLHYYVFE